MNLEFFKRKELGLPIWVWAAIVSVVLFLLYLHFKRTGQGNSSLSPVATDPGSGSLAIPDPGVGGSVSAPTPLDNTNPLNDSFNTIADGISAVLGGQASLFDLFSQNPTTVTPAATVTTTPTNGSSSQSVSPSVGTTPPTPEQKVSPNLPFIDSAIRTNPGATVQQVIATQNALDTLSSSITAKGGISDKAYPNTNPTGTLDVSPPSIATPKAQAKGQRGSYLSVDG